MLTRYFIKHMKRTLSSQIMIKYQRIEYKNTQIYYSKLSWNFPLAFAIFITCFVYVMRQNTPSYFYRIRDKQFCVS